MVGNNTLDGRIHDSYAMASVSGNDYVGGLVGMNSRDIYNCYSTGTVTGVGETIGGFLGATGGSHDIVIRNYWDIDTSGTADGVGNMDPDTLAVLGKTTAQMQMQSTFMGWDFGETWTICEGTNYPRSQWQILSGDITCPDGVNMDDLAYLASYWGLDKCNWFFNCGRADIDGSGEVGIGDLVAVAEDWLRGR